MMTILLSSFSAVGEELDNITDGTIWGDLEVSDSIRSYELIPEFSLKLIHELLIPHQEMVYSNDEFGLTIWRPDIGDLQDGLKCYAMWDQDTGKLSLLLNGTDRNELLKFMTIAKENTRPNILKDPDINMQLYTYLEQSSYMFPLKKDPQFNSTLTDRIFKFDYFVAGSEGDGILDPIVYNWNCTENKKASNGKITDSIRLIPEGLKGYYLKGIIRNGPTDKSIIVLDNDNDPWAGNNIEDSKEKSALPLPSDIKLYLERKNITAYARIGMAVMADDLEITGHREVECEGNPAFNETLTLKPQKIDLNKVDFIAWPPLKISRLKPDTPSVCRDENGFVQFSWKTNLVSNSTVWIREEGEREFRTASQSAMNVLEHNLSFDLGIGKTYYYYVASYASCERQARSMPKKLQVGNCSVIWACKPYDFPIPRDYDQNLQLCILNRDSVPHNVTVKAINPYDDLIIGFLDDKITIGPNEKRKITLKAHAQDANRPDYMIDVRLTEMERNQTDEARVKIHIDSKIDFTMREVPENDDCSEIVKTIRITNTGRDTLTDLNVSTDGKCNVILQPQVSHAILGPGDQVDFKVIALYSGSKSVSSMITATAYNVKRTLNVSFACNGGAMPIKVTLNHPQLTVEVDDWYCTNRPDINVSFSLIPGFDASDVISAKMLMDFNCGQGYECIPHYLQITLNGNKNLYENADFMPGGIIDLSDRLRADDLRYSDPLNGSCRINEIRIKSRHNPAHYVVAGKVKIILCLKKLDMMVCAPSEIEGEKKLLSCIPGIAPVYSNMSVDILSPWPPGKEFVQNQTVPVSVAINGTDGSSSGPQKGAIVRAFFNSNETAWQPKGGLELFDDGKHNDSSSNDGIYANNWTVPADAKGFINITVRAKTCIIGAENKTWILIPPPDVDLAVSRINILKSTDAPGKVRIEAQISNLGNKTADPSNAELKIGNITNGMRPVGNLSAGENLTVEWKDLSESELCGKEIVVFADSLNKINETDEANNFRDESYCPGCPGTPDLTIDSLPELNANPNELIPVNFTIRNLGGVNATDPFSVNLRVYNGTQELTNLSQDLTISDGLASQESRSIPAYIEPGLLEGVYNVTLCIAENGNQDSNIENDCMKTTLRIGDVPGYTIKKEISANATQNLMFHDSQGRPLYYWIEKGSEKGNRVTAWINVPHVDQNQTNYINMTTSATDASQYQDPEKVFLFFDDFASSCPNGCSGATGAMSSADCTKSDKWSWDTRGDGGDLTCENDSARIIISSGATFGASLKSEQRFSAGSALMFRMDVSSDNRGASKYMGLMDDQKQSFFWVTKDKGTIQICRNIWPSTGNSCWESIPYSSGYKRFEMDWVNSTVTTQIDNNRKEVLDLVLQKEHNLSIHFNIDAENPPEDSYMSLDWVAVRKLVEPEPVVELRSL